MNILMIDNYDSFTYNVVHYLQDIDCHVTVKRNDQFEMNEPANYDKIILSPGPGLPDEAGLLKPLIANYAGKKPILGICLGLQAIGEVFGANLSNLDQVCHGIDSEIDINVSDEVLFKGLPSQITVGRYHSWVISKPLPKVLEATSFDSNNHIMSIRHKTHDIKGLQFHPESILTPKGKQILTNWVNH